MLHRIVNIGELGSAHDPAAVLDHRLQILTQDGEPGPLPWLRGIPSRVAADPVWGPYLQARGARVDDLAVAVRTATAFARVSAPWVGEMRVSPENRELANVIGEVTVWRAATGVSPEDERPTGAPVLGVTAAQYQRVLDGRLDRAIGNQAGNWSSVLPTRDPALARDPLQPQIARRLYELERRGIGVQRLLEVALAQGPLPDDHAAAALWWRVTGLLSRDQGLSSRRPSSTSRTTPRRPPDAVRRPTVNPNRSGPSLGR